MFCVGLCVQIAGIEIIGIDGRHSAAASLYRYVYSHLQRPGTTRTMVCDQHMKFSFRVSAYPFPFGNPARKSLRLFVMMLWQVADVELVVFDTHGSFCVYLDIIDGRIGPSPQGTLFAL